MLSNNKLCRQLMVALDFMGGKTSQLIEFKGISVQIFKLARELLKTPVQATRLRI